MNQCKTAEEIRKDLERTEDEIAFHNETKLSTIKLLEKLNDQTENLNKQTNELINQNKKLSDLTKWLIFLTLVLGICTIFLVYYAARAVN